MPITRKVIQAPDWTGSAAQRRPQGTCRPPKPDSQTACQWIPAGTPVMVRPKHGSSKQWKRHTTRIDLQIEETIKWTDKSVMFIQGDWTVAVAFKYVRHAAGHEFAANNEVT